MRSHMSFGRISGIMAITVSVALLLPGKVWSQEKTSPKSFYILSGFLLRAGYACPGDQRRSLEAAIALVSTPELKKFSAGFPQSTRIWMEEGGKNFNSQALKGGLQPACAFAMQVSTEADDGIRSRGDLSSAQTYTPASTLDLTQTRSTTEFGSTMVTIGVIVAIFVLYFFPSFVAKKRRHANSGAIWALNLFLGWTMLGWVAALVWSLTDNVRA